MANDQASQPSNIEKKPNSALESSTELLELKKKVESKPKISEALRAQQPFEQTQKKLEKLGEEFEVGGIDSASLYLFKHKEKHLKDQDPMFVDCLDTYVSWNLIGSLYKPLLQQSMDSSGYIDMKKFWELVSKYPKNTITDLKDSLKKAWSHLSETENQILNNFNEESNFSKDYIQKRYSNVVKQMDDSFKVFVEQYNSALEKDQTIFQKGRRALKWWVWYVGEWVGNVFTPSKWKEEPTKTLVGATALAGGVYVGYKAINWLFGDDSKESKNIKKKKSKKGFLSGTLGTLLKGGLVITWWALLVHFLATWKWLSGLKDWVAELFGWGDANDKKKTKVSDSIPGSDLEKQAKQAYEKDPEIKKIFDELADAINAMYSSTSGQNIQSQDDRLGESEFEKTKEGQLVKHLIPTVISSRYETVWDLLSEKAFFYEVTVFKGQEIIDSFKKRSLSHLQKFFGPVMETLDAATFKFLNIAKTSDEFMEKMKWAKNAEQIMQMMLRKTFKTCSYFQTKKKSLELYFAKEYLNSNDPKFSSLSPKDQLSAIQDRLSDSNFYKTQIQERIKKEFLDLKMLHGDVWKLEGALVTLKKYNLLNWELDPLTRKELQEIDNEHKEIVESSTWLAIQKINSDKVLEKKDIGALNNAISRTFDDIEWYWKKCFWRTYLPLTEFFNTQSQTKEIIEWAIKSRVKPFSDKLSQIKKNFENWKPNLQHIQELENFLKDFHVFKREIALDSNLIHKTRSENGNVFLSRTRSVRISGEQFVQWFRVAFSESALQWGAIVAWSVISLDVLCMPRALVRTVWYKPWWSVSPTYSLGKLVLNKFVSWAWYKSVNFLPTFLAKKYYTWPMGQDIFQYDFLKGKISPNKALSIAKSINLKNWINVVWTIDDLFVHHFGSLSKAELDLLKKYWSNDGIRSSLVEDSFHGKFREKLTNKKAKTNFYLKREVLEDIGKIEWSIAKISSTSLKKVFESALIHAKDIDHVKHMVDWVSSSKFAFDHLFDLKQATHIDPTELGRFLSASPVKVTSTQFQELLQFADSAAKAWKIPDWAWLTFVKNSLDNRKNLASLSNADKIKQIELLDLNKSKYQRLSESLSRGLKDAKSYLGKLLKNKKVPLEMQSAISDQLKWVDVLIDAKLTPENLKAIDQVGEMWWLDVFKNSDKVEVGKMLSILKTDKQLLKSLSKASTVADVELLLSKAWIDVTRCDGVLLSKISQTKNTTRIIDLVNYAQSTPSIKNLWWKLNHPTTKAAWRIIAKLGIGLDVLVTWIDVYSSAKEAQEFKTYNIERWNIQDSKTVFTAAVGAWWLATSIIAWSAAGWPLWLAVWLGVVWVASGIKSMGDVYYDVKHEHYKNFQDFYKQWLSQAKLSIVSLNAYNAKVDDQFAAKFRTVLFNLFNNTEKEKIQAIKTVWDALNAIALLEETQRYSLSSLDLNNYTKHEDQQLVEEIKRQKNLRDRAVEFRKEFFKGFANKNILDPKVIEEGRGLQELEKVLSNSRMFVFAKENGSDRWVGYLQDQKQVLRKQNQKLYDTLEHHMAGQSPGDSKKMFVYEQFMLLPYFEKLVQQYWWAEQTSLLKNIDYFKRYMSLYLSDKDMSYIPKVSLPMKNNEVDLEKVDFTQIKNFLKHDWVIEPALLNLDDVDKLSSSLDYCTDDQILERYNVSQILGQQILFRIATEVFDYQWPNRLNKERDKKIDSELPSLKSFFAENGSEVYKWIYFDADKNAWMINDVGFDNKLFEDNQLNTIDAIKNFEKEIKEQMEDGDLVKVSHAQSQLNLEIGKKMLSIIHQELECRTNKKHYQSMATDFIKQHSNNKFIMLPSHFLKDLTRAGFHNIGMFAYRWTGTKFEVKWALSSSKCELFN